MYYNEQFVKVWGAFRLFPWGQNMATGMMEYCMGILLISVKVQD
jgi:hypothetical protein